MKAVIMAGGRGTRLRPLTCYAPKPMVPLLDRPCMEYIIELLKKHSFTDIAVTVQYLPQVLQNHFGDGHEWGVNLQFFEESVPLGTAGSVKNAERFLDETFLVISGDGLTDFDLGAVMDFHRRRGAKATVVLTKVDVPLEYGVVMTSEDGKIVRFLEKPSWSEVFSDTVNTGIYVLEPDVLQLFAADAEFDFSKDLFPRLLALQWPLYGYVADGYWSDIGNLAQYRQTQFDMLMGLVDVRITGSEQAPRVWIGEDVQVAPGARIQGPSFIGSGSAVSADAEIGPYAVIGRNNQIDGRVSVERTVLWNGNYIGASTTLTGATICDNCQIGKGVDVYEGAVIGDKSRIGEFAAIRPGVKIWPEKTIGQGTIQQTSLIWGHSVFHSLFDEDGISGLPNIELIPELAGRIAASYASNLRKGSTVSVSCDEYPYCSILKFSVISSLLAAGVQVRDIGVMPVPVVRYEIRRSNSVGGIHIRSAEDGEDKPIVIQFFDAEGLPIEKATERKIENAFLQEDFSRPDPRSIGSLEQGTQIADLYIYEVLSRIRTEAIVRRRFKVVFCCESQPVLSIMQPILEQLGCAVTTVSTSGSNIGETVVAEGADIGIKLDTSGQKFLFYTERGYCLTRNEVMILQMLIAVKENTPMAVPVTAPSVIEEMGGQTGIPVVRTKTLIRSILEVGRDNPLQVHYDGFYSVVSLFQFLAEENMSLHTLIDQLPRFHMRAETVPCPPRAKGRVMRMLMEEMKGQELELIDGIKVLSDDGWALIMPDAEKAMFKIVAQGNSHADVDQIIDLYKSRIAHYRMA